MSFCEEYATVPDNALLQALCNYAGLITPCSNITVAEINSISSNPLDLANLSISNISGLEHLSTSINEILLQENFYLVDLAPISSLSGLSSLNLSNTSVYNLSPISNLNSLTSLFLVSCPIDYTTFNFSYSLEVLDISDTGTIDLSVLETFTDLSVLILDNCDILNEDLNDFFNSFPFPVLDILSLSGLNLEYIPEFHEDTSNITSVDLSDNSIVDLLPLIDHDILDISDTGTIDLSVLETFTDLSVLILDNCDILNEDLNDFFNSFPFPVLDILSLSGLNLEYIPEFHEDTSNITSVDLSDNSIVDLLPLIDHDSLVELSVSNNLIIDPTPLFLLGSQFENLSISYNHICGMDAAWLTSYMKSGSSLVIQDDILEQTCDCATKYPCYESFATDFVVCKTIQNEFWAACASVAYYNAPPTTSYYNEPLSFTDILFTCNYNEQFAINVVDRSYDRECSSASCSSLSCIFGWYGDECDDPCPITSAIFAAGHSHCVDDIDELGTICHDTEHYCECGDGLIGNSCNILQISDQHLQNGLSNNLYSSSWSSIYVYDLYDFSDHLDLNNLFITDIQGLRFASNVPSIDLGSNSDLSDISELNLIPHPKLEALNLRDVMIMDLNIALSNLYEQIIELHLTMSFTDDEDDEWNVIEQIEPFVNLQSLGLYDGDSYLESESPVFIQDYVETLTSVTFDNDDEWNVIEQIEPFVNLQSLGLYDGDSYLESESPVFIQDYVETLTSVTFDNVPYYDLSPFYLLRDSLQFLDISNTRINFDYDNYPNEIEAFRSHFATQDTLEIIASGNRASTSNNTFPLLSLNERLYWIPSEYRVCCTETSYLDARTMNPLALSGDISCIFIDPFENLELHDQCFGLSLENKMCVGVTDDGTVDDVFIECISRHYGENCDSCVLDEVGNICPNIGECNINNYKISDFKCGCQPEDEAGIRCNPDYRYSVFSLTNDYDLAVALCVGMGYYFCSYRYTDQETIESLVLYSDFPIVEKLEYPSSSDPSHLFVANQLKVLSFEEGTHLEDLSFIARMWHLRSLDLGNVQGINKSMFEGLVQAVLDRSLEMELDDNYSASETYCFGSCHLRYLNLSGQSLGLDINDSSNSFSSTLSLVNGFAICSGDCSNKEDIYPLGKLLTHVDLSSNSIYDPSIIGIQPSFRRLTHIDLSENNISDISLVGALIKSLDYIHNLDLSGNMLPCASDNECNTLLQETMPSIDISGVTLTFEPQYELVCGSESCGGDNMTCIVQAGSPTCACLTGYYLLGESCIEDVDGYCSSSCTGERGICKVIQDDTDSSDSPNPVCVCSDEWYGDDCDFACPIDNDGYLCGNDHGSCDIMSHSCSCDGYTGSSCEIECDADVQCSSNGLCSYFSDVENGEQFEVLICECESGYYGSMCQSSVPVEIFIENGSVTDYICGRDYSSPSSQGDYSSLVNEISHSCDCSDNGFAVSAEGFCIDPSTHPDYKDIDGNDTACVRCGISELSHGSCVIHSSGSAFCSCDYGYGEEAIDDDSESFASDTVLCSTFICGVSSSLDLGACNGHGSCLLNSRMSYECQCDGVWSGISCSLTSNETSLLQWFLIVSIFVLCALIISLLVFAVIRRENKKYYLKTTLLDSENLVQKTDTEKERPLKIGEMVLNPSHLSRESISDEHLKDDRMETLVVVTPHSENPASMHPRGIHTTLSEKEDCASIEHGKIDPELKLTEKEGEKGKIVITKRRKKKKVQKKKTKSVEMSEIRAEDVIEDSEVSKKKRRKKRK
ncbi:hypothetical protein ADUPG1_000200 [Aduncisulcus paluster]|uniref:EGF-like domain-containing protein n=1 Tax=Aduncisulcus paluster TaxID=2918883 RepID=A0ABQ5K907_9EUKA|nr:hypothetical protein ADUPG1_000200 [Aduncisulcus paluster]